MPFITPDGSYYDGSAPVADGAVSCPIRPDRFHSFQDGAWVKDISLVKAAKIKALRAEGLRRISAIFPAITDIDQIQFIAEFWLSIAPAARQPTANFQKVIDIRAQVILHTAAINALLAVQSVESYDVVNTPAWPT